MPYRPKPATDATAAVNREAVARYAMDDRAYFADDAPAPDTVNPSLWRQPQVMRRGGLYRVADGIHQVRNNDIANLTVVEGDTGLVVIDRTAAVESARQGMALIREHVSDKPVAAVIYTHTHVDHYGGVKGVVDAADAASGKVPIVAPGTISSFDKHAIGENVIAGNAMSRRAGYAFGSPDSVLAMPLDILFDFAAVHLIGDKAADANLRIDFTETGGHGDASGGGETWTMWIRRGVLNARRGAHPDTQLTVTGPKAALVGALLKPASAAKSAQSGALTLTGDESALRTLASLLDDFDPNFPIVTP